MNRLRKDDPRAFLSPAKSSGKFAADVAELRRVLDYSPEIGEFRWSQQCGFRGSMVRGAVAGSIRTACGGYRWICINKIQFRAHVLAWVHHYGALPLGVIDHINGNPADNRILNLRVVSIRVNCQNQRKPRGNNTSGYLGVSLDKRRGKFSARIRVPNGAYLFLGYHQTAAAAHDAYLLAKRNLHEGCTL